MNPLMPDPTTMTADELDSALIGARTILEQVDTAEARAYVDALEHELEVREAGDPKPASTAHEFADLTYAELETKIGHLADSIRSLEESGDRVDDDDRNLLDDLREELDRRAPAHAKAMQAEAREEHRRAIDQDLRHASAARMAEDLWTSLEDLDCAGKLPLVASRILTVLPQAVNELAEHGERLADALGHAETKIRAASDRMLAAVSILNAWEAQRTALIGLEQDLGSAEKRHRALELREAAAFTALDQARAALGQIPTTYDR